VRTHSGGAFALVGSESSDSEMESSVPSSPTSPAPSTILIDAPPLAPGDRPRATVEQNIAFAELQQSLHESGSDPEPP